MRGEGDHFGIKKKFPPPRNCAIIRHARGGGHPGSWRQQQFQGPGFPLSAMMASPPFRNNLRWGRARVGVILGKNRYFSYCTPVNLNPTAGISIINMWKKVKIY
jgi:hypothetical protein